MIPGETNTLFADTNYDNFVTNRYSKNAGLSPFIRHSRACVVHRRGRSIGQYVRRG